MKYKIYQVKDIKECKYAFRSYEYAKTHGLSLNDYYVVYEGDTDDLDLQFKKIDTAPIFLLESLFYIFNNNRPEDFKGHSISVSDIVDLGGEFCYCDPFGWKLGIVE